LLAGTIGYMVLRLGGLKYVFYRLGHHEAGLYEHRASLFQRLSPEDKAIVFLGDSQIEQCEWNELLKGHTQSPIINRGIVGDQVEGVANRLPEITRHNPSKVFICVGINDLIFDKGFHDIELKYHEIVRTLRNANRSTQIVVVSVLPVNGEVRNVDVTNEQIGELNIRLQQVARSFAVPYLDLYSLLLDKKGNLSQLFTTDGIHLNGDGYAVWRKALLPLI
jgi:lysophospholipase L1-like esterase